MVNKPLIRFPSLHWGQSKGLSRAQGLSYKIMCGLHSPLRLAISFRVGGVMFKRVARGGNWGGNLGTLCQWLFSGSPKRWDRWHITLQKAIYKWYIRGIY